MEKPTKVFTEGFIFKKPRQGAPDFVKGAISVKVDEFTAWLKKHNNNGWVNIDLKMSKEGKLYTELNNFKRDVPNEQATFQSSLTEEEKEFIRQKRQAKPVKDPSYPENEIDPNDIPFE